VEVSLREMRLGERCARNAFAVEIAAGALGRRDAFEQGLRLGERAAIRERRAELDLREEGRVAPAIDLREHTAERTRGVRVGAEEPVVAADPGERERRELRGAGAVEALARQGIRAEGLRGLPGVVDRALGPGEVETAKRERSAAIERGDVLLHPRN